MPNQIPKNQSASKHGRVMEMLPVWPNCCECNRLADCADPFPPSNVCSHPFDRVVVPTHPPRREPRYWEQYVDSVRTDNELKSFCLRWQTGLRILEADFLKLREKALLHGLSPCPGPRWLIWEFIDWDLHMLHQDFVSYYEVDDELAGWVLQVAFNAAILIASPEHVLNTHAIGGDWQRYMVDMTRTFLWGYLELGFLNLDDLDNNAFRKRFEEEWEKLLPYRGLQFDFRVIPRLSWDDFVRYQKLPYGKAVIRSTLSCYMTHQTFVYPHVLKTCADKFKEVALFKRLREVYQPLIESTVQQISKNLSLAPAQNQEREEIRNEVKKTFETALQDFDFYWRPTDEERVVGPRGLLGLTEDKEKRAEIDKVLEGIGNGLRTQDVAIYVFAHYIKRRLHFWATKNYPADAKDPSLQRFDDDTVTEPTLGDDTVAEPTEESRNETSHSEFEAGGDPNWSDSSHFFDEAPDFTGPDGHAYMMIQKAARRYGLSEDQLRRMDTTGSFPALRAGDVLGTSSPVDSNVRLYLCSSENDWLAGIAKARAETRSSALQGKELNRRQAAKLLGVRERQLRHLENSGKIKPSRKGSLVVYDEGLLTQAATILAEREAKKARNKRR